jgi:hypothetical protein
MPDMGARTAELRVAERVRLAAMGGTGLLRQLAAAADAVPALGGRAPSLASLSFLDQCAYARPQTGQVEAPCSGATPRPGAQSLEASAALPSASIEGHLLAGSAAGPPPRNPRCAFRAERRDSDGEPRPVQSRWSRAGRSRGGGRAIWVRPSAATIPRARGLTGTPPPCERSSREGSSRRSLRRILRSNGRWSGTGRSPVRTRNRTSSSHW